MGNRPEHRMRSRCRANASLRRPSESTLLHAHTRGSPDRAWRRTRDHRQDEQHDRQSQRQEEVHETFSQSKPLIRMGLLLESLVDFFLSLRLTVVLLILSMILVFSPRSIR